MFSMNKLTIYACLFAAGMFGAGCNGHSHSEEEHGHSHGHEHSHAHAHDEHDHDAHDHDAHSHDGEIAFHDEQAEQFGVRIDTLRPSTFCEVVRVSGRAETSAGAQGVVSAPVAGVVRYARGINAGSKVGRNSVIATIDASAAAGGDAAAAAREAYEAAKREVERLEPLYADRLVTATEYNAALSALAQAKPAYSPAAVGGKAVSPIAGIVAALDAAEGQYVGIGDAIATVVTDTEVTLRFEVPRRYLSMLPTVTGVVVEMPGGVTKEIAVPRGGMGAASGSNASAYVPVFFTVPAGSGLMPGSTFTAYLRGIERPEVLVVPVGAISEQQGSYFVYELEHPEAYAKRRVQLGATDGKMVEIKSGIHPGAVIVAEGAPILRLAETGAAIPEGHTHNH